MTDVASPSARQLASARRQRSIYQVHYCLKRRTDMAVPLHRNLNELKVRAYGRQVAGHKSAQGDKYLGVLQCNNGTILKPILKDSQKREIDFYEHLSTTSDAELLELKKFTPKYYGCRKFTYNGYEMEYIVLEDLCERMVEPCIMDVKIGRITYDPLASPEKIAKETSKYSLCKQQVAFCIPGYQVYRLPKRALLTYGKEHGKAMRGDHVKAALKNFLNSSPTGICRQLILHFLSSLWRIQRWASRQTAYRLYACSLLLVYDANKMPHQCMDDVSTYCHSPVRRKSIHSLHSPITGSNFSGQITNQGPVYKKVNSVPLTPMKFAQSFNNTAKSPWQEVIEQLSHNHSFEHNYEDKLTQIKVNYRALLDEVSEDTPYPNPWATVKLIDFAHAFYNDEDKMAVDENFREGIDNVVALFEELLRETDDQVFLVASNWETNLK